MGVSSFNGLYVFYETLAEIRFYESENLKINDQLQNIHSKQTNKMCDQLKTSVYNKFLELKQFQ